MTENLNELIAQYGEQNDSCNKLKKVVTDLNSKIKKAIHELGKENTDIVVDGWKCSLSVTDSSDFNEDRLLEFCKQHNIDVVKTKEYVDAEALEKLIYNGDISKEVMLEMDSCRDIKTRETLRCVRVKEK